jgi:hypothetical protein
VNQTNVDLVLADLPPGTNMVAVDVTDGTNTTSCATTVTVTEAEPPVLSHVSASPNVLWPPNHKMVPVEVRASASGTCSAATWKIIQVSSNEGGDGDGDWRITGNHTLLLRAERSGGRDGRTYYITVQATDASGNQSPTQTVTVRVPKSQGKKDR